MSCKSVYLIDDDIEDVAIFKEAVEVVDSSVSLCTAFSCEEAISFFTSSNPVLPDMIFLDLNLPGMTGKQCLVELRKIESIKHIPIVIYTTSEHSRDIEGTFKSGASYFLTKPDNFIVLCSMLEKLFKIYPFFVRRLKTAFSSGF